MLSLHATQDRISWSSALRAMEEYANQFRSVQVAETLTARKGRMLFNMFMKTCEFMEVSPVDMVSPSRKRELTDARAIFCRRAKLEFPGISWSRIGSMIGRDHATALFAARRAETIRDIEKKYNECYARKTSLNHALMAILGTIKPEPNSHQDKGPVLSHLTVEEREPLVSSDKPAVFSLP